MPTFKCDGLEFEVADPGTLAMIRQLVGDRESQIKALEEKLDQSYKVGDKEYKDMGSMYKDMMRYYKDMCKYKDMVEKMKGEKEKSDSRADALQAKLDAADVTSQDKSGDSIVEAAKKMVALSSIASQRIEGFTIDSFNEKSILDVKKEIVESYGMDSADRSEESLDVAIEIFTKDSKDMKFDQNKKAVGGKKADRPLVAQNVDSEEDDIWGWTEDAREAIENAWTLPVKKAESSRNTKEVL